MGDTKFYLLLLLCTITLTHCQEEEHEAPCLMAKRYKPFHKYEYLYEAESLNALNGAINGPKGSCKVVIEVPGACSYIVHTTECTLSEVVDVADGAPVFRPAAGAEAFKAAMEKNSLKVTVEGDNDIKLFPEDDEPMNILNIKRGLISALAVPVLEEERNKNMPTIYGMCKTDNVVNGREDIATDITLHRDLSRCDKFRPVKDHTSPLALITGLHYPLAQLIRSTQTCNYKFDNEQHHPISGTCTEKHILLPASHKGKYGITNVGKQALTLQGVTEYNERFFDHNVANMRTLHPDGSVDMSPIQDKDAVLAVLRELAGLSRTDGHKRAHLAHKVVSMIRKMSAETLAAGVPQALEISRSLTYQALFQCGTPECSSAILQILRTFDSSSIEIDAAVYAIGLVPNPSRVLVKEMLEVAKFKPSKPIYYATSNAVRRLYQAEGVTPEIHAVANYALEQIGDCTGDQDHIFLSLRVIGNMAAAMGAASPGLKSAIIQCVNQPAATPEVQEAAIQAYRLTPIPEEGRKVLMQVLLDGAAPIQKRVAAYLILIKDPQPAELAQLAAALPIEENAQAKSFIISHLTNILSCTAPETQELRQKILDALQGNEVGTVMDPTKFSRNYKAGSLQGNMIFDSTSHLPKEVMLEMTLKAFGYNMDMVEIGMEGRGLEPTVEALFGANGFFPDTVLKTIYYAADKMPLQVSEVLRNILPALRNGRKKRQASQNIIREIGRNVNKLIRELKANESPEAMVYLRLLGAELGYLKTKDMEEMAYSAAMMMDSLIKMFPTDFVRGLLSSADNELFFHYIFMDNEFYLPTGPGVPLRVALSGTFTPGIKGGLKIAPDMSEVAFMPSAGIEFVTEIGAHFPDFVQSGLEMHTNIYHESGLTAKVAMTNNQVKLTIPAPQGPVKLISLTNSLVSVTGAETKAIPTMTERVDVSECTTLFPGLKYCTDLQYSDAMSNNASLYFPFTGDSKLAIELHPTGEVSEYTATIDYAYEEKVDKVTIDLKAEGSTVEATATVMFNRKKYTVSADLQIPDYDLEAGLRFGAVDPSTKGKATHSIQIDLINKHIPQASLVALAKIEAMKDAMLQVKLLVPSLHSDAAVTANLKYDVDHLEVELKSDVTSEIQNIIPNIDAVKTMINGLLDQQIGQTEMKVRDLLTKSVEVSNAYLEKSEIPYVQNLRVPGLPKLTLPEKLYLNTEAAAKYHFSKDHYTIALPLPLGGKSSEELNFPAALTTPHLAVPQLGLVLASISIPLPEIFVPETLSVSVPYLGMAEVSAKVHSNFYNLEAAVSAGRDAVETPSYSAKVEVTVSCPVDLFCLKVEGSALVASTPGDSLKAEVKTALTHKLIDASVSVMEVVTITDKVSLKSSSKIEATSPLGVQVSLEHTGQFGVNAEEISGDGNLEGSLRAGPIYGSASLSQALALFPFRPEAKIDSTLKVDSTLLQAENTIAAAFANGELSVVSNTAAFDTLTNVVEVTFKEAQLAMKTDTNALALGLKIQNLAEATATAGTVNIKVETTANHAENRIHSLVTATLDVNGLALNSDGSAKLADNTAAHKATLTLNKDGLATSGTTSLQSLLTLENTIEGALDASKASLSIKTKGAYAEMKIENANSLTATPSSVALTSKAEALVADGTSYTHDIYLDLQPFAATVNINNDLMILHINLVNEAQLKAEPFKADLTGSVKLSSGEKELKHTYEISYADLVAIAKCSTTGKILGAHASQNTEVEVAGLTVRINNDARFYSQPLRYDNTIRATFVPFSFNLDAIANADGDLDLYGKQSAQVYAKVLLKAEPLAFAHSQECRFSTTQNLDNGVFIETNLDNKIDTLLTPSEQKATVRVKSKVNNHAINQEVSVYNTPERLGLELSGAVFTNLLNTADNEIQDFSMSGYLKYDKNTESHVINLPFIESLPAILENVRITFLSMAEAVQDYINREDITAKLEALLQHISDFVTELNLEGRVVQLRQDLIVLTQEYIITLDELEASLVNLRALAEKLVRDLAARVHNIVEIVKEMIVSGTLSDTVIQRLTEELHAFNEEYYICAMILAAIEAIEDVIKQIDLMNLNLFEDMKNFVASINIQEYADHLIAQIPTEQITIIVDTAKALITELDIIGKLNTTYGNVRAVLVTYEVDKRIEALLEKVVELVKHFKIDENIQVVTNTLKTIHIPVTQMLEETITYLKATEIKQIITHLNEYLDAFVQRVKSFDYNAFVDEAKQKISEYSTELNTQIVSLEIPQRFEATRELVNYTLSSLSGLLEELRTIRVADVVIVLKDIIDSVALNDFMAFAESLKERAADMDLRGEILQVLQQVSDVYTEFLTIVTDAFDAVVEVAQKVLGDQPLIGELKQIFDGVVTGLKAAELDFPSFTVPLTDLVLPSMKISLDNLQGAGLPAQVDLPEFTILGFYTVPATTITYDDLKQRVMELIDFITNFEIHMFDVDAFFEDLAMNYLPDLSSIALPEITLPEISLPAIPKFSINMPLQIPEIKLPDIPSELLVPCFGKLYGEVRVNTPIYSLRTSAEFQNSTNSETTPQFTAFLTSQGTSPSAEILNYNLDSTARLAIPKLSRVIVAETIKFTHSAFAVEHQASVTFYGISAQASAKTTVKATTTPYTADIVNNAFFAFESGMSASLDTTYNHKINIPLISFTSEAALTQKAVARQEATTVTLTVGNEGTGKVALPDFSDEGTHKSDLHFTMTLNTAKLTFTGDTDSATLKMKQIMNADAVILSHITFDARVETKSPFIKNSLVVATGKAHLGHMKVEVKATHATQLVGALSGTLSNAINVLIRPMDVVLDFQNKGNTRFSLPESLSAKIDLQNDYGVTLNTDMQQINTFALARFNQYKYGYNFTIDNNKAKAGIYAAVNGEANLEFLTVPISIPEFSVPFIDSFIDLKSPVIRELNLYEHTGLNHLLTTPEQTVYVDTKIVYHKSRFAPLFDLGLISIPTMGKLISDVSFKSSLLNLNANTEINGEDDLVIRLGATTASVFEGLKAKLDGTSSLTTKRGLKLATALSLENAHIEGTHDSAVSLNTDDLEAIVFVANVAKINLPILTVEANQQMLADNKIHPNAAHTLKVEYTLDIPVIKAVSSGEADHSLKLEGSLSFISAESSTKGSIDGNLLETGVIKGALDNEATIYLNADGLRSTLNTIGNANVNHGDLKVEMDVDESLALEAVLSHVYAVLKLTSNNEVKIAALNTKGKHAAKATIDLAPLSSLAVNVEIDLSQPSTLGDLSIYDKIVVELTGPKQKVACTAKIVSPVYTTNVAAEVEGDAPIFKVILKASATSPVVLLEYDLDGSVIATLENEALSLTGKAAFNHADLTMDIQHVLTQSMSHTLNVDITSPTFTDVNFRYAARRDGISTSISTPSTGFLRLQLQGRIPSQLHARLYSRYASAPENDVDILTIKATVKGKGKMHLQAAYNLEAPNEMILGLKERLPAITSTVTGFADKYGILAAVECLKSTLVQTITKAYTVASSYAPELSQLSVLFRNVVVQYQKTVQVLLDAAIKFLTETQIQLPGMEETTLPKILHKVTSNVAAVLEQLIQVITANLEAYLSPIIDTIATVQVTLPSGEVLTGAQILGQVKSILTQAVEMVKNLESLDLILQKLGKTFCEVVQEAQEFVDSQKSDILNFVAVYINALYINVVTMVKSIVEKVDALLTMEQVNALVEYCMDMVMSVLNQISSTVSSLLPNEPEALVKVSDGRLEIELPFPFH